MSVSGTRAGLAAVKSARHERDRHVAMQAARAALLDAERDIAGAAGPASPRTAVFAAAHAGAFVHRCAGSGEHAGLCALVAPPGVPAWQAIDLESDSAVEYGRFTGAAMPLGAGLLPARAPRYVVELLPGPATGASPDPGSAPGLGASPSPGPNPGPGPTFRITAIGFGASASTRVVLQGYYQRAGSGAPARRLGWREIANWPELHAAAQ
jgi:Tfp pilus assembly protein PilX